MEIGPEPIGPPKRSGCMVTVYVLFGVGLFVLVAGGIATWVFLQTEQGQKVVEVVKQGAEWMTEATQAPGTAELRDAGCEMALVSEMSKAFDLFMTLLPDEEQKREVLEQMEAAGNLQERLLVMCTLPRTGLADPDCGGLARTYAEAVPTAPDSFFLVVVQPGDDAPSCQGVYSTDGTLLETPKW
jgi:hypothetical protein